MYTVLPFSIAAKLLSWVAPVCMVQGAESAGLHAAVLDSATQPVWDLKERALLTLKALLQAGHHHIDVLNSLDATTKLQSVGTWAEIQDTGYRDELQQLHASVLSMLAARPQHSDEL